MFDRTSVIILCMMVRAATCCSLWLTCLCGSCSAQLLVAVMLLSTTRVSRTSGHKSSALIIMQLRHTIIYRNRQNTANPAAAPADCGLPPASGAVIPPLPHLPHTTCWATAGRGTAASWPGPATARGLLLHSRWHIHPTTPRCTPCAQQARGCRCQQLMVVHDAATAALVERNLL